MPFQTENRDFLTKLETLFCTLLARTSRRAPHGMDGLILRYVKSGPAHLVMSGLAIYAQNQTIDPFHVTLKSDVARDELSSGRVYIGFTGALLAVYGSLEHGQMENRLLSDPVTRVGWRDRFMFARPGWREVKIR